MANHCLNQGLVKYFFEDRADSEKMALTLLHPESDRNSGSILCAKYRRNMLFLGSGRNDCLGHGFSAN